MRLINAQFVTSQVAYSQIESLPEVAMVGRSNVGKSSLINMLTDNGKLAKTSNTPGRTRLINHFKCVLRADEGDTELMLVDLPGYGFAKGSKQDVAKWAEMIEGFLEKSENLTAALVLVDIRHAPNDNDRIMLNYLYSRNIPFVVVATKADKLSKAQTHKAIMVIAETLRVGKDNIIVTSATAKSGATPVVSKISQFIKTNA